MKPLLALALLTTPALSDAPVVEQATATRAGDTWTISATLSHPDTGWDHYADGWEVLSIDGTRLGLRDLAHPHVKEQPFTRSLSGVTIPDGTDTIQIRARCLVDGWSQEALRVTLESP